MYLKSIALLVAIYGHGVSATESLVVAAASSTPASASESSQALAIAAPNENDEHAIANKEAKSGLRKAKFDEVIPPSDQHHRNLQTTIYSYPYTFTKVGEGLCRDSNNNAFDRVSYEELPNVAACADACATCPGQNQAGVPLLGFHYSYNTAVGKSFCGCVLELPVGATFASNSECATYGADSQADQNSGTGDITQVHVQASASNAGCYKVEIERVPSSQPSTSSSLPSLEPSTSVVQSSSSQQSSQTLATGCPEEYNSSTTYDASDKVSVSNGDGTSTIYTCKPFPESQLCNMYLYSPTNTLEACAGQRCWPRAWIKEPGTCEGTYTPTSTPTFDPASLSGCPAEYTTGTVYKAGDEISVTPAGEDYGKIYKCKDWPYTAFCNEYTNSPANPAKLCGGDVCWPRAWTYEGGCYGTISPTPSPTMRPQGSGQAVPCPSASPWVLNKEYKPGDRVSSYDHLNVQNNIYVCNGYPWSTMCGQSGFQPGQDEIGPGPPQNEPKPSWEMAWTLVGPCTYTPPVIKPFDPSRRYYEAGERVTNKGKVWECRVWPFTWLCHEAGYEPGVDWHGSPIYLEAWQEVLPTNAPSISIAPSSFPSNKPSLSSAPSTVPSKTPSTFPSESPSDVPSKSPSDKPSTSSMPSELPSSAPSNKPSLSVAPSNTPSKSLAPTSKPSFSPSVSNAPSYAWCQQQKNVCISLDSSGSVRSSGWKLQIDFSKELVEALVNSDLDTQFSVVTFSTSGTIRSELANATETLSTLDGLPFENGMTNTKAGIDKCQETLADNTDGKKDIMVLLSDGYPNRPSGSASTGAVASATAAKNSGTFIVTLFINSNYMQGALDFMKAVSSENEVLYAPGFDTLDGLVETLKSEVFPC